MTSPEVVRCADGHFCRVIYGLGPYIADYPEQALLACVVQGWCPRYVMRICHDIALTNVMDLFSCTARVDDLDNTQGTDVTRRCHEHTDALLEAFTLKELWDDYGIVGDVVVSTCCLQNRFRLDL